MEFYATQEIIKSLGYKVEHLRAIGKKNIIISIRRALIRNIKNIIKFSLALLGVKKYRKKFIEKIRDLSPERKAIRQAIMTKRKEIFEKFWASYLDKRVIMTHKQIFNANKNMWGNYDYILAGSDQIWNDVHASSESLKLFYLYFADRDKRINYASSFGVSQISKKYRKIHVDGLNGFDKLSCREQAGCELIKNLIGQDAELVLDPTLLLNSGQWLNIAKKPNYYIPDHYALTYFLFDEENYLDEIHKAADGLKIVRLYDRDDMNHFTTDPCGFIWLIANADYVLTNSFHGTAFSINFNKNFIVFGKNSRGWSNRVFSRIETLLENLGLMSRAYEQGQKIPTKYINYDDANIKLAGMREKSINYLRSCLK